MINYRVDDLAALLKALREEGMKSRAWHISIYVDLTAYGKNSTTVAPYLGAA